MNNEKPYPDGPMLLQALTSLEVDYWFEVDHNWVVMRISITPMAASL
jgi:hypothetical protein